MIEIKHKENCCGCSACVQACPVKCISLIEDEEGFSYPHVNKEKCIECGLCEKICPFINQAEEKKPLKVLAAKNPDEEIRLKSSSGGIFSMLAECIIEEKGVVFGVCFDENWQPVFDYSEDFEGIAKFRGSKYVQASVGTAYYDARKFLKQGRKVLFSGTPCQIAGLNRFLKEKYDNLYTVDVVCHGVPSPLVWRQYIEEVTKMPDRREGDGKNTVLSDSKDIPVITGINFRDKMLGWKKYSFVVRMKSAVGGQNSVLLSDIHRENLFMQAFLNNLILRPSCYACKAKAGRSGSDITIADFWGIESYYPEMDDDKGTGLVLLNTEKGQNMYDVLVPRPEQLEVDYQEALAGNPCIEKSVGVPILRERFWKEFSIHGVAAIERIYNKMKPGYIKRVSLLLARMKNSLR